MYNFAPRGIDGDRDLAGLLAGKIGKSGHESIRVCRFYLAGKKNVVIWHFRRPPPRRLNRCVGCHS
jgi:hypothetical protein